MDNDTITAPVLAFVSTKGGLGRSTLTFGLAAELALAGYRTIVIDIDPNRGCTSWMMSRSELQLISEDETAARVIQHPELGCSGIIRTYDIPTPVKSSGIDLNPSSSLVGERVRRLDSYTLDFIPGTGSTRQDYTLPSEADAQIPGLRRALSDVQRAYDVVLLDTPSSGDRLIRQIHDAADYLLLLFDMCEARLAREDYIRLRRRVDEEERERARHGRPEQHAAVVRVERGCSPTPREIAQQSKIVAGRMLDTIIPNDRAAALKPPPQFHAPTSLLSRALSRLAAEVVNYAGLRFPQ